YDLGSEDIIHRAGTIQNNQFIVGERAYTTVVIPPGMDNLNRATWELLKEYLAAGGNVLAFERVKTIDGKKVADLGIQHASGYREPAYLSDELIEHYFQADGIRLNIT